MSGGTAFVWDPDGRIGANLNGEFVVVRNLGSTPVDLSGWLLRDSSLTSWYYYPAGSVLAAGDYYVMLRGYQTFAGVSLTGTYH